MSLPSINSAHGSDTRNVINRAIEVLNKLGIDIQSLVAEGQLTPEQYADLIRTVNGLIAKGEIKLDDLSPEVLSALSDANPEFNLLSIPRDKSVTPEKTNFFDISKNLFNKNKLLMNKTINGLDNGTILDNNGTALYDGYISVNPNTTYYKNKNGNILFYDDSLNLVQFFSFTTTGSFTTTSDTHFLRITMLINDIDEYQLELGNSGTPYEPFYNSIKKDNIKIGFNDIEGSLPSEKIGSNISTDKLDGWVKSKNLFDKFNLVDGYVNIGGGDIVVVGGNKSTIEYIPVESGAQYTFSPIPPTTNANFAFYESQSVDSFAGYHRITPDDSNGTFTVPSKANFLRMSVRTSDVESAQLEKGSTATPYEPYYAYHSVFSMYGSSSIESTKSGFVKVNSAYDVTFYHKLSSDLLSTFRFSNSNTGDDFMKGRESSIYSHSGVIRNKLFDLTNDTSNKEFAIRVQSGSDDAYFPEHNSTPTGFEGASGFRKLTVDGREVDLTQTSVEIEFNKAVLAQRMEFKIPNDNNPRAIITFIATIQDGILHNSIRVEWKQNSTIPNGYVLMTPMNTAEFVDNALSDNFEFLESKPNTTELIRTDLTNLDTKQFIFTSDRNGKTNILFKTEVLKSSEPNERVFFEHRNGLLEKMYLMQYDRIDKNAGDIDYFEGTYSIDVVPNANELYSL